MTDDPDFIPRLGRIRSSQSQRDRSFLAQARASIQKAGGRSSRHPSVSRQSGSRIGRGRAATVSANRLLTNRSRGAVIKSRFVRHAAHHGALAAHLGYLRREGVTRDGEKAKMFGPDTDDADPQAFAERCQDDRHHFRFIVSPDDALEMEDLRSFTRDLMAQVSVDLDTKLDWVAVDHWNTQHPHIHVIMRGRTDDGQDLVINPDYLKEGMRSRARDLITLELGPRTDRDIRQELSRQIHAERWTQLDRQLAKDADRHGVIDLAPEAGQQPDQFHSLKVGRMRHLESLGLAHSIGGGQWMMDDAAESTLREISERNDIIKRIHRSLNERGLERATASYVLAGESLDTPIVGRLIDRGLDDELRGSAYAVVDGIDGRTHHVKFGDLNATGDGPMGSIVELRVFDDAKGRRRVALAMRSDWSLENQVTASGATWLDRQAVARDPGALGGGGFGAEVSAAMERRAEHLIEQGLAQRHGQDVIYAKNLIGKLRQQEVEALGKQLAAETGKAFEPSASGDYVAGTYRQRYTLASGRFALIDDGLGFQLVPWSPSLEKQLERHVSGVARDDGGVDWGFGKNRGLGL